jgi:uncharacterized protein
MTRVAVDTSALLALASPRDQYHARAVNTARRFVALGGRWVGSVLVLAELHGHMLQRRGPTVARNILTALRQDPAYVWHDVTGGLIDAANALWLERFSDQRFSLTDAVTFALMKSERITVAFAFDQDFVTAGYRLLDETGV